MAKLNIQQPLSQSSVSHNPYEIVLIYRFVYYQYFCGKKFKNKNILLKYKYFLIM